MIIECHFDAFNGRVNGAEALVLEGSDKGNQLAKLLLNHCHQFNRPVRGVKALDPTDFDRVRGVRNLVQMNNRADHCAIFEPFFGDSLTDFLDADFMVRILSSVVDALLKGSLENYRE